MGLESETGLSRDAFIARFDLCDNLSDYLNPVATDISFVGTKCKKHMKWAWTSGRAGKQDMFGYSAVSPDKSYVIAAGTRQGSTKSIAHRWLVKFDANTGEKIWEIKMPSTDAGIGQFAGYESIVFTADGGFIAGGFANGEQGSMDELNYKSGGQVDSGNPLAQKFSAAVANTGKTSGVLSATPEWTYQCGGQGSTNCSGEIFNKRKMPRFTFHHFEYLTKASPVHSIP